ncbi:MAG: hypothetical protein AB7G25_07710 [Sphingomonadaceae bacterium]
MSRFSPSVWVRRLEALGGYVMRYDGRWSWGVQIEDNLDEVQALTAEIRPPEHAAAVRQYVSGRP